MHKYQYKAQKLHTYFNYHVHTRVETGLGHLSKILFESHQFIKYLGLCSLITVSGAVHKNELSVLYGDDGNTMPDSQYIDRLTVQLEYLDHLVFG